MDPLLLTLTGALGGALLAYGFLQRAKANREQELLAVDIAHGEGWLGIGIGGLLLAAAILSGCGSNSSLPLEQQYHRLDWARISVHQAEAECYAEVQRNPLMGFPVCMRAKGWQEVR